MKADHPPSPSLPSIFQKSRSFWPFGFFCLGKATLLSVTLLTQGAPASDFFRIRFLSGLNPTQTTPFAFRDYRINNAGEVIGNVSSVNQQAAFWRDGSITPFGMPSHGTFSAAYDLNDSEWAACQTDNDPFVEEFAVAIHKPTGWTRTLYPSGYRWTIPAAISNLGMVVGSASVGAGIPKSAFYLLPGATTPVILGLPSGTAFAAALAVNDNGLIGGVSFLTFELPTPTLWNTSGGGQVLPSYSKGGGVQAISNSNIAVGYSNSNTDEIAIYWDSTGGQTVGHPITYGVANGINSSNIIVGNTVQTYSYEESRAWFKSPLDSNVYLVSALQASPNLILYSASDINDSGQFVGRSNSGGYIATPVITRVVEGAWNSPSNWLWGIQPAAVHPVRLSSSTAITITGPTAPVTVSELVVGANVRLTINSGQSLNVVANGFGDGTASVSTGAILTNDGSIGAKVSVAGLLGGGGMITGNVTIAPGGFFLPGNSPGTFGIVGNLNFDSGANLAVEINGLTGGAQYDQVNLNGVLNLNNANLLLAGSHSPTPGETFVILENDGDDAIQGTFKGLPEGAEIQHFLGSAYSAMVSYRGGNGNDVALTVTLPFDTTNLASLSLSSGALTPAFQPQVASYAATVEAGVASILIDANAADPAATVAVNGGDPQNPIALGEGENLIFVEVTARNHIAFKQYQILVTRLLSPFRQWAVLQFGIAANDPLVAGHLAAPAGDSTCNLLKYALGIEPYENASGRLPVALLEGGKLVFLYTKLKAATDVIYRVEWSDDLTNWFSSGVAEEIIEESESLQKIKATLPGSVGGSKRFARLLVSVM